MARAVERARGGGRHSDDIVVLVGEDDVAVGVEDRIEWGAQGRGQARDPVRDGRVRPSARHGGDGIGPSGGGGARGHAHQCRPGGDRADQRHDGAAPPVRARVGIEYSRCAPDYAPSEVQQAYCRTGSVPERPNHGPRPPQPTPPGRTTTDRPGDAPTASWRRPGQMVYAPPARHTLTSPTRTGRAGPTPELRWGRALRPSRKPAGSSQLGNQPARPISETSRLVPTTNTTSTCRRRSAAHRSARIDPHRARQRRVARVTAVMA